LANNVPHEQGIPESCLFAIFKPPIGIGNSTSWMRAFDSQYSEPCLGHRVPITAPTPAMLISALKFELFPELQRCVLEREPKAQRDHPVYYVVPATEPFLHDGVCPDSVVVLGNLFLRE
jgi:hypothetical protein